jgi:threonine dehydrogenase-like Zn-dependent dehydrogenase
MSSTLSPAAAVSLALTPAIPAAISLSPASPAAPAPQITVVGAGVVGLTTAVLLQRYGAKVSH